jgi:hypothetical protein
LDSSKNSFYLFKFRADLGEMYVTGTIKWEIFPFFSFSPVFYFSLFEFGGKFKPFLFWVEVFFFRWGRSSGIITRDYRWATSKCTSAAALR